MTILNEGDNLAINNITIFTVDINNDMTAPFYQKIKKSWVEQFPHNRIIIYDKNDIEVQECLDNPFVTKFLSWGIKNFASSFIRCHILAKHNKYLYIDLDVFVYNGQFIYNLNREAWHENLFPQKDKPIFCCSLIYSGIDNSNIFIIDEKQMTHWSSAITKDNWMNICTDFCLNYNISNCRQLWGYFHISLWNLGNKKVLHTNEPLESIKLKLTEGGDYVYETSEVQHIFFTNVENTEPSYFEKDNLNCTSIYVSPKTDKEYFINLVKDYLICRGQTDIEIV